MALTASQKQHITDAINVKARKDWFGKQTSSVSFDDTAKSVTASIDCTEQGCGPHDATVAFDSQIYDFGDQSNNKRLIAEQLILHSTRIITKSHIA